MRKHFDTMTTEDLIVSRDEINTIIARRLWAVGDKCVWRDRAGVIHQGTVKTLLPTGLLGVAKKGDMQWGSCVDPVEARRSIEAFAASRN